MVSAVIVSGSAACSSVQGSAGATSSTEVVVTVGTGTTPVEATATTPAPPPTSLVPPLDQPPPTSADELARALTETERAIRDPSVDTETARAAGRRAQRLYAVLNDNEQWADRVTGALPLDVRTDVELHWSARRNLSALVTSTSLATEMPLWRIREPLGVDELMGYYREAEEATGIPWSVLAAIHLIESRMGRIEGLSTAGAVGPMQFLPSTWAECCVGDPTSDRDAIMGAAVYLDRSGAATDLEGAVFAYNRSDRYVRAVLDYATVLDRNELAYRGLHGFEVWFRGSAGLVHLAAGYDESVPIDAAVWLAAHPEARVD
jgi:hypothetical protein